jgi:hypothetical protein
MRLYPDFKDKPFSERPSPSTSPPSSLPGGGPAGNELPVAAGMVLGYEQVHPGWQAQTLDVAALLSR